MSAANMESFERFSNHPLLLLAIKVQNGELSLGEAFNQACQQDFLINLDSKEIEFLNEEILRYSQQNLTYYEDSPFAAMYFAVAGLNYRVSKARFNRLLARSAITFGLQMQRFNQFDKAIELYLEALDNLSEQEKQIAPMVYNYLGTAYHSTFEFANAVGYYKKSVETARALDDQYWASIALGNLGVAYQDSGDNRSALACYQEGLELSRELKTPWSIAQKLESIGSIYREQGYVDKAIEHFEESLSIAREMGDRRGVASLLNKLGTAHANTGNMKQAVNYLSESLQILASGINDSRMLSSVMSNLGGVLKDQGATRKARELFEQSLELARQADDQRGEADVLCNMASAHYAHGEHAQALAQSEEALKIYQKIGDRQGEAVCLGNMAVVRLDMNQAEATIEMCDQALKIVREIGDPWGEAAHLTVLANAYLVVGSFEEAIHHFQQALTIAERIGDLKTASECWTDLGLTARTQDELDKAEECYHKGLELSEQIGDRRNQIRDLVNLGVVHHLQRDHLAAGERFQEALHMSREVADSWSETSCLINLGLISARASKTELALDYYDQAIKIAKAKNYVEHLYRSYHGLGILYRNSDLEQSYKYFAQAIETLEGLRAGFSDPEFKMGFLREKESSFETMVDLLITLPPETAQRLKIDAEKELFHYIEMAKSKVLLDLLGSPRFRMTDLDQQDPDVLQEKKLRQDLDALFRTIRGRDLSQLIKMRSPTGKLESAISSHDPDYARFLDTISQHRRLVNRLRRRDPQWAALQYVESFTFPEIQKTLPEDVALVSYFVTRSAVVAMVADREDVHVVQTNLRDCGSGKKHASGVEYLREQVRRVRVFAAPEARTKEALNRVMNKHAHPEDRKAGKAADRKFWKISRELYDVLVGPIEPFIDGKQGIIFSGHRELHYLPLQVLWNGEQYLTERFAISYVANASILKYCQPKVKRGLHNALLLGYSRGDSDSTKDDRSTPYDVLPGVEKEIGSLAALFNCKGYMDKEARISLVKREAKRAEILHLACHGDFTPENVMFTALLLASDGQQSGRLTVREIMEEVQLEQTELVVLSACDLGLGRRMPGDDLLGMTRAWLYAGAPSIVVSLWSADDRSTAEFMVEFYKQVQAGMSKAQALQKVQVNILNKARSASQALKAGHYAREEEAGLLQASLMSHPYFWAPFVLVGNPV